MRLVKLSEFIETQFAEGSRPDRRTVIKWIERGRISPEAVYRPGRQYFIDLDKLAEAEVDALVQRVLDAA